MRTLVILLVGTSTLNAEELPNGIYAAKETGKGVLVKRADGGGEIVLGAKLTDYFGTATISSIANDNSRFTLRLKGAGPFPQPELPHPLALAIDGVYAVIGSNSDLDANARVDFTISINGKNNAEKVAKALKVKPILRQHPGHQLLTTFEPLKESYSVSEPVTLRMRIKNVGKVTVRFLDGGQQRGARNNQFGFIAFESYNKPYPDTGDPTNFGGKASYVTLKPGDELTKDVDITKWFDFKNPGTYSITGIFELELSGSFDRGSLDVVWNDFAVGRCTMTIEGRSP